MINIAKTSVCVIGMGYIGLPVASLLATKGYQVLGVDVRKEVVDSINNSKTHIVEPSLDILVKSAVNSGNLRAASTPEKADVFVIAVPTPLKNDHEPDLSYVESATRAIAPFLKAGDLVILESTSPLGTTEAVGRWLKEEMPGLDLPQRRINASVDSSRIYIAHCPERVLPGKILQELIENDRVIGGLSLACGEKAKEFYQTFVQGECILTDCRTSEMTKLTENTSRDVSIAFANELSIICQKFGIDVWELIELANRHPRVNILQPGPGVGGHCIAVDPWFLVHSAKEEAKLIRRARLVNDSKPDHIVSLVKEAAEKFKDPVIACLGLAFKANIDDLRESPALEITRKLAQGKVGRILAVEPYIDELPETLQGFDNISLTQLDHALAEADILLLLVNHDQFAAVDRELLQRKVVIDTRGQWR